MQSRARRSSSSGIATPEVAHSHARSSPGCCRREAALDAEAGLIGRLPPLVGAQALPLFFLLLVLLLALTWLGWWAFQRWLLPREQGAAPTPVLLLLRLALGFGAIVFGAWTFAEIAEALHAEAPLAAADQALADSLRQSVPPAALQAFAWLTLLADPATLTVLCVGIATLLLAQGRRWLAIGWVAAVAGNALLNVTLKQVFARVRPVHDDGLVLAHGFSFPSGHSSGAVVAYGMLAYVLLRYLPLRWHLPMVLASVALAFSIGASRMFLRVHFASDVIAGFASGSAWLAVCIASIELTRWYQRRAMRR
ncbi:MAG: phosphatase PAP2 family protein [Rhizobiales bacterium]|nr:phosphatase PAP2 family protein [Rhizobacter sp.]